MKTAFMFPGQGAQVVGMGKDFYETETVAKEMYEKASEITKIDIPKLCFEVTQEELNKTENTQIAIAVTSLAILEVVKKRGIKADTAVGLSLGEYVALIYAGYISLEEALPLIKKRGEIMGNKLPKENYQMAAVIGLESTKIEELCNVSCKNGKFVVPANYNYSMQTVISGMEDAVEDIIPILKQAGAKKVVKLKTSGPFHTCKLEKAKQCYEKELEKVNFITTNEKVKVIKNLDGTFYKSTDCMKEILANHIINPVRFDKTIQTMRKEGVTTFIEIGPGKTLSGFVKKEIGMSEDITIQNF